MGVGWGKAKKKLPRYANAWSDYMHPSELGHVPLAITSLSDLDIRLRETSTPILGNLCYRRMEARGWRDRNGINICATRVGDAGVEAAFPCALGSDPTHWSRREPLAVDC